MEGLAQDFIPSDAGVYVDDAGGVVLRRELDGEPSSWSEEAVRGYIPPYVRPGSWRRWDPADPCPAGFACTVMGNSSFGAFSCDEMARIAAEEFGFGDVLAGTYCPEGEMGVLNCEVGGYCPDSVRA